MSATNPFSALEDAVITQAASLTELKSLVAAIAYVLPYDGQEPLAIASEAAKLAHAVCYVRVFGGGKDQGSGDKDDAETLVHLMLASPKVDSRHSAARAAKALLWTVYAAMRDNRCQLSWLMCGLQFRDWELIYQKSNCVIVSLVMATRFSMAEWTP